MADSKNESKNRVPQEARKNDPDKTEIILTGRPTELKPAISLIMAISQLQAMQREYFEEISASLRKPDIPRRTGHPLISLYFKEDKYEVAKKKAKDSKYKEARAEISFRLMAKTEKTITQKDLEQLGKLIKSKFAIPPFTWDKGKELSAYTDPKLGLALQLWVKNKQEGKRLVEQILDCIKKSPDWEKFNHKINEMPLKRFDPTPGKEIILGKSIDLREERPQVQVKFVNAQINIPKLRKPIYLVDLSNRHDALIAT